VSVGDMFGTDAQRVQNFAHSVKVGTTGLYFGWVGVELVLVALKRRSLTAITSFPKLLKENW
jgi:hypothetical protein